MKTTQRPMTVFVLPLTRLEIISILCFYSVCSGLDHKFLQNEYFIFSKAKCYLFRYFLHSPDCLLWIKK